MIENYQNPLWISFVIYVFLQTSMPSGSSREKMEFILLTFVSMAATSPAVPSRSEWESQDRLEIPAWCLPSDRDWREEPQVYTKHLKNTFISRPLMKKNGVDFDGCHICVLHQAWRQSLLWTRVMPAQELCPWPLTVRQRWRWTVRTVLRATRSPTHPWLLETTWSPSSMEDPSTS